MGETLCRAGTAAPAGVRAHLRGFARGCESLIKWSDGAGPWRAGRHHGSALAPSRFAPRRDYRRCTSSVRGAEGPWDGLASYLA